MIVNGKKLYSVELVKPRKLSPDQIAAGDDPRYTVKSKGVSRVTWAEMEAMLRGESVEKLNHAPTFDRFGNQKYQARRIHATAPIFEGR